MYKVLTLSTNNGLKMKNHISTPRIKVNRIVNQDDLLNSKAIKFNYENELESLKKTIDELVEHKQKYEEEIFTLHNQIEEYEQKLDNSNLILDKNFEIMKEEEDKISQLRKENINLKRKRVINKEEEIDKVIENSENILRGISNKTSTKRMIVKRPLTKKKADK